MNSSPKAQKVYRTRYTMQYDDRFYERCSSLTPDDADEKASWRQLTGYTDPRTKPVEPELQDELEQGFRQLLTVQHLLNYRITDAEAVQRLHMHGCDKRLTELDEVAGHIVLYDLPDERNADPEFVAWRLDGEAAREHDLANIEDALREKQLDRLRRVAA